MRFEPENGLEVRVRGRLTVYEPRGEYQVVVEVMEPLGVGALQLAFSSRSEGSPPRGCSTKRVSESCRCCPDASGS